MSKRQQALWDDDPPAPRAAEQVLSPSQQAAEAEVSATSLDPAPPDSPPPEVRADDVAGKVVYVVDAHALIYQVFHAMPDMTSPSGQPVGAVHGFIRDVVDLLEKRKPDYLFCAFDHSAITFRNAIFADYKVHREEMPSDLRPQINDIRRMLQAMGVAVLEMEGFEADDILATMAAEVERRGGRCLLVTHDKDCRQLISEATQIYNIRKNQTFGAVELAEQWKVRPDQVVDFQALVGDSVDNVPGVPLIGPKIAADLLGRFETLEGVLANADQVSGKKRSQNLVEFREQALMSRTLVRLAADVPITIDWELGLTGRGMDPESVEALSREFGFRRLAERIDQLHVAPATRWESDYRIVPNLQSLADLLAEHSSETELVLQVMTEPAPPRWAELIGVVLAWKPNEAHYVPLSGGSEDTSLPRREALELLRPLLEDARITKLGHNLKVAMVVLETCGIALVGPQFDCMVADYLLDPGERNHTLEDLSRRYLRHTPPTLASLMGPARTGRRLAEVRPEELLARAGQEVDVPARVASRLRRRLADEEVAELFAEVEMPLSLLLGQMESRGIRVDAGRLDELGTRYATRLSELEATIYALAGEPFSIESPKQLADVLFNKLGLPTRKKTKSGPSTDAEVLGELAEQHELPGQVLEYRQYAKLKGTYVDALQALIHPDSGRVHTTFKQDVAATGRLSSSDPNLQNIPIRTEQGREIRSAFVPGPADWQLLTADYSQIELRVLAHFSQDAALRAAFEADHDVHAEVASQVHGVPLDEVTGAMRRQAKAINFGVIYGQSPFGLAKALGISKREAATFIDAYFSGYPGVERFMAKTLDACRKNGYVTTTLGRRRIVQGVRSSSRRGESRQRNLPERIAINTVIQGSAADLIKQAMLQVHRRLQRDRLQARMLLQIHDELVFEVPPSEVSVLAGLLRDEMTRIGELSVPLKVDVSVGGNWSDCLRLEDGQDWQVRSQ